MQTLFTNYWALILAVLICIIYSVLHFQMVFAYAKKQAKTLIIAAEKRAEVLLLADGPAKLAWVVDKGYDLMPVAVRIIISKPLFKVIVQDAYDAAVRFAKLHITTLVPVVEPETPLPVVIAPEIQMILDAAKVFAAAVQSSQPQ